MVCCCWCTNWNIHCYRSNHHYHSLPGHPSLRYWSIHHSLPTHSLPTGPFTPYRSIHSLPVYQSLPVFIIHHRSITHPGPSLTRATTPPPAVHRRMDPARVAMTCLVANYADYSDLSPTIHHPSSKSKSKSKKKNTQSTCHVQEDHSVNRLEDSVLLWKSICSNPLLAKVGG